MTLSIRSLSLLTFCSFSSLSFAADVPGSQDLPIVPRMTDSQIVDYRPATELERIYPMGSIRKISGQLRFDGQVSARGHTTSVTYELPPEQTSNAAFTTAREALQKQDAQLLFWCQARDCGESSLWANEVFGNAKLYGSDEQQAYLLLRLAAPNDNTLVALYGITRGNRKAYLHVEQFDATAPLGNCCQPPRPCCVSSKARGARFSTADRRPRGDLAASVVAWPESGHYPAGERVRAECRSLASGADWPGRAHGAP